MSRPITWAVRGWRIEHGGIPIGERPLYYAGEDMWTSNACYASVYPMKFDAEVALRAVTHLSSLGVWHHRITELGRVELRAGGTTT